MHRFQKIPAFLLPQRQSYWLSRFVFLRLLGFVYFFAFLSLATQVLALLGEEGLLPASMFLESVEAQYDSNIVAFLQLPTLFWINSGDQTLLILSWIGVLLSLIVLAGYANSVLLAILWFLYMSYIHIGQVFYGYGWETLLLETGFLAIFFIPLIDWRPFPKTAPPAAIVWLLRWLTLRVYLGAGLIKIRGDSCWRDFTCLFYHYETQPIPNPLSPYFHFLPHIVNKAGVAFNHLVELAVPFFVFWPRTARIICGVLLVLFQLFLIIGGNYSFLNWITITIAIGCFDDRFFRKLLPKRIVAKADQASSDANVSRPQQWISWVLVILVVFLSFPVVKNLLSEDQAMNTSFNRLHLVNTYGAFGSVGKERYELILIGKDAETGEWKEYEFKAKPGNIYRSLPVIAPYQPRIDWQIWFAAMQRPEHNPWLIHMIWKLLHNDDGSLSLLAGNPFPDKPPSEIRIDFYRYAFAPLPGEAIWERTYLGQWLPPLSSNMTELKAFIDAQWGGK